MDEKTKAQIQQEAADLVAKLQPRSGKFRTISPEMDPLRLGSGWSIEIWTSRRSLSSRRSATRTRVLPACLSWSRRSVLALPRLAVTVPVTSAPISATARPRATTALTTRCPAAT